MPVAFTDRLSSETLQVPRSKQIEKKTPILKKYLLHIKTNYSKAATSYFPENFYSYEKRQI